MIFAAENSNKFQKTRFWKEKSVEDKVTLWPTAQASRVIVEEMYGDTNDFIHELLVKTQTWVLISSKELQFETFSQAMAKGVFLGLAWLSSYMWQPKV